MSMFGLRPGRSLTSPTSAGLSMTRGTLAAVWKEGTVQSQLATFRPRVEVDDHNQDTNAHRLAQVAFDDPFDPPPTSLVLLSVMKPLKNP
jgi:hypothetical protein